MTPHPRPIVRDSPGATEGAAPDDQASSIEPSGNEDRALVAHLADYDEWQIALSQQVDAIVRHEFPKLTYLRKGIPPGRTNSEAKPDGIVVPKSTGKNNSAHRWVAVQFVKELTAESVERRASDFVVDAMSVLVIAEKGRAISASAAVTSAHLITTPSPDDEQADLSLASVLRTTLRACFHEYSGQA